MATPTCGPSGFARATMPLATWWLWWRRSASGGHQLRGPTSRSRRSWAAFSSPPRRKSCGRHGSSISRESCRSVVSSATVPAVEAEGGDTLQPGTVGEVFRVFLRLGLTSFGGPVAHLGYFRNELVLRRKWIDEPGYADLVAHCQFLPGPASSQVGFALGLLRAGPLGGLAAWSAFTLPSAILLLLFARGMPAIQGRFDDGVLHSLKV